MIYRSDLARELTHEEMDNNFLACLGIHNLLHVQDRKAAGVAGGTFTAGAWRTRDLNTILTNNIVGASLANNQITLPDGIYHISGSLPFGSSSNVAMQTCCRLYNMALSRVELQGQNARLHVNTGGSADLFAFISGSFILDHSCVIELQHISMATQANTGFGWSLQTAAGALDGLINIYSDLKIWKVA